MEPLLVFVAEFWWIAPATAGAAGVGYAAATTRRRRSKGTMSRWRAKRLEVEAARHDVQLAYRGMLEARAEVRAAQARVQLAQAHRANPMPGAPSVADAKRDLQRARQAYKSATMALRASRTHVKAVDARRVAAGPNDPLPLERLVHEHDAITARWLEYETDPLALMSFPQMSDANHPATLAFLRAQSDAHRLRPTQPLARMRPEEYAAYRVAVARYAAAFAYAETEARRAGAVASAQTQTQTPRPGAASRAPRPTTAVEPGRRDDTAHEAASDPAPPPTQRAVWPIPARTSRPSGEKSS